MLPWLPRWLHRKAQLSPRRLRPGSRWRSCRLEVEELESRLTPSAGGALGLNMPLTTDPGVQQMPSVAVDPLDSRHLAVAYMDYSLRTTGYAGIGEAVSLNGGDTWQRAAVPLPVGFDEGAGHPFARFDDQGRLFVTYMAATFLGPHQPGIINPSTINPDLGVRERTFGFQSNNGIFVVRSDDGGLSWDQPVAVIENLYDGQHKVPYEIMPELGIDTFPILPNGSPNPNHRNLYEVWAQYYPSGQFPGQPTATGGSQLFFAVSHDGGQTWELQLKQPAGTGFPVTVIDTIPDTGVNLPEGTGFAFWSHLTVGPEGDIYVANSQSGYFAVHRSTDGGKTFTNPDPATNAFFPFGVNDFVFPSPTLANSRFRTIGVRSIAADPLRPGYVYVADSFEVTNPAGNTLDESDIIFARSTDYGLTWQTTLQVGTHANANVLNDDNDGSRATGRPDDVTGGQTLPHLVTDAQGDVAVIWYDTRRDPADHLLDVFGTISSDGGKTFSPNFRVTDQSFDPDAGRFTDAEGKPDYYLGDSLGLALANGTAFAAWTDTRNSNQDIFFSRYAINPPPAAANDRFEPNDTAATATKLGRVVARDLPKLAIASGDEDWFRVQAAATGSLTATATLASPGDSVRLELRDASGETLLATGTAVRDANGQVIGQYLTFPGQSGQTYLVRVLPGPGAVAGTTARYALEVRSLTADLGTQVYGVQGGSLATGRDAFYALTAAAPGSLEVTLTPGANAQGNFHLELLDPSTLAVLASGQTVSMTRYASLAVTSDQAVYLHVFGDVGAQGDFTLTFTNLDQFTTPDNKTLFFPTGEGPSESVLADVNGDGNLDIVVSHIGRDVVSVLLNNGDGTFQAPRDYAVGAFVQGSPSALTGVPNYRRDLAVADFNGDGIPDIVVVNHDSGDLSILFGRGDGTFQPQRRLDATAAPFALAVGDLNNDGIPDLIVVDSTAGPARGVVLLGRGDGTFAPLPLNLPPGDPFRTDTLLLADLNHDGKNDLVYRDFLNGTLVLLGNGDGTFRPATQILTRNGPGLAVADLNGDGNLDVLDTINDIDSLTYSLGNGDGTFQPEQNLDVGSAGRNPVAVAVVDFGSVLPNGSLGPPDGHPDLIVVANGLNAAAYTGPPEVLLLPGLVNKQGQFAGFGHPIRLASPKGPLDVKVGDVNGDGVLDVVAVDRDGILVIYGKQPVIPPNDTLQTARNLGTVVHLVEPAQTIVPGRTDAYYTLRVPTEAARGAGDEVLDFSGFFQATQGAGINIEVRDAAGNLLRSGERFRVQAQQGQLLTLHIFGVMGLGGVRGFGAFTLDIDVLPQLVSIESQPLLPGQGQNPGGPTASLVLTFQGDRLDPATAEGPANYRITWLGPDGIAGTADDQVLAIQAGIGNKPVVYDPSTNVNVASGNVYPTAIRQTVTLLFTDPLPAGSYQIELSPAIQTAPFNSDELALLTGRAGFTGHPVVSRTGNQVTEGSRVTAQNLVFAAGALGDFGIFQTGTPFLTQLHDDLGALLDAELTRLGDSPAIPGTIDDQIVDRFDPALGPVGQRPVAVLVIWLDPVSPTLLDSRGSRVVYDQQDSSFVNTLSKAYVNVTGNLEVIVLPFVASTTETLRLSVADVASTVRGGVLYFGADRNEVRPLTADLRSGTTEFLLSYGSTSPPPSPVTSLPPVQPPLPLPPGPGPDPGKQPETISQDSADSASLSRAAFTLVGTRTDSAPVSTLGPFSQVNAATVSVGPGGATAQTSGQNTLHQLANSSGSGGLSPESPTSSVEQFLKQLAEMEGTMSELVKSIRDWVKAMGIQLPGEGNRSTPKRPRTEEMPMQAPPEEEEETLSQTQEVRREPEESSPEAATSADCVVSVVGLGVCVVGLSASGPIRRRRNRKSGERGV